MLHYCLSYCYCLCCSGCITCSNSIIILFWIILSVQTCHLYCCSHSILVRLTVTKDSFSLLSLLCCWSCCPLLADSGNWHNNLHLTSSIELQRGTYRGYCTWPPKKICYPLWHFSIRGLTPTKCTPTRKSLFLQRDFSLFIGRVLFALFPSLLYKKVFSSRGVKDCSKLYVNGSFEYNLVQFWWNQTVVFGGHPLHSILTCCKFVDFFAWNQN